MKVSRTQKRVVLAFAIAFATLFGGDTVAMVLRPVMDALQVVMPAA